MLSNQSHSLSLVVRTKVNRSHNNRLSLNVKWNNFEILLQKIVKTQISIFQFVDVHVYLNVHVHLFQYTAQ